MSMMYPNGSPTPSSQFQTGQQPNYGQGLVNFNQIPQALQQAWQQRQQQQKQQQPQNGQPGQPMNITPGAQQGGNNIMAGLRKFFTPGQAQAQPGSTASNAGSGFGPNGGAPGGAPPIQTPGASTFGGSSPAMSPPVLPNGGATFDPNGLY